MLKKLNVFGTELAISQFADDTTLLLKDEHQIPIAIQNIEIFSRASGLFLNIEKCELLSIHENAQNVICDIPVKTVVKYLSKYVTKKQNERDLLNLTNKLDECKQKLNVWLQRDLSIFGRTYLTKMESISRGIHPASSLALCSDFVKSINQLNFNFIWRN